MADRGEHDLAVAIAVAPGTPHQEPERGDAAAPFTPAGGAPEAAGASPGIRGKKMLVAQGAVTTWQNWTTPESFLDVVRELGPIVLDPFWNDAAVTNPVLALQDSIEIDWLAYMRLSCPSPGIVFCNPPYGPFLKRAIPKLIYEGAILAKARCELISLLPAKTDTRWWHALAQAEHAGCFWRGRLSFGNPPPDTPGDRPVGANYVSYFGRRPFAFANAFAKRGIVRVRS